MFDESEPADWEDERYFDDSDEEPFCHRCHNAGTIIVCPDDMCRGCGECMHGDGEIICPDCGGANLW